jgi:hypothetical protein
MSLVFKQRVTDEVQNVIDAKPNLYVMQSNNRLSTYHRRGEWHVTGFIYLGCQKP